MNALRTFFLTSICLQFLAGSTLFAERYGDGLGIPIKLTGAARAMPTGPAEATLSVDIIRPDGSAQTISAFGSAGGSTSSERFLIAPQSVSLEPGRTYSIKVYSENTNYVWPLVVPPLGYEVQWSGQGASRRIEIPTPDPDALGYYLTYVDLKIVPAATSTPSSRAGVASKLANGGIYWQVSMGSLSNGTSAGYLELAEAGRHPAGFSDVYSYQSVNYTVPSGEVFQSLDGGRQIVAPEAAVDIKQLPVSSDGYTIKFYSRDQVIDNGVAATPRFTFTGTPYVVYTVRSPNGTTTALEIVSETRNVPDATSTGIPVARTAATSVTRTGVWPSFTWTRYDWTTQGAQSESREIRTWSAGALALDHNEQIQVLNSESVVARSGNRTIKSFSWGEEATNESAGSASNQIVTDRTYYTSTAAVDQGSLSYPRLATTTGGSWEAIEYFSAVFSGDELLDTSYQTGVVKKRIRPFLNTPSPSPTTDLSSFSAGEVTSFEYSVDYFTKSWGLHYRPTKIETKVDGTVTRLITQTYADSTIQIDSVARPLVTVTRTDKSSPSAAHVQIIKYYREDTPDLFLRKQFHSIENADGTKDSYSYERGAYLSGQFTAGNGAASRVSVIHGTISSGSTVPCPSPATYELDPVFLVPGKSLKETVVRDEYTRIRKRETHVFIGGDWALISWEAITYDRANQITEIQTSNGLLSSRVYNGELLQIETDFGGVERTFTYDAAARIISSTEKGGPRELYGYDAEGRVVTVSVTGGSESIISSRVYDSVGRVVSVSSPGVVGSVASGISTTRSYDTANRVVTSTNADGGTRITYHHQNGMLQSVSGTATVAEFYSYAVSSEGYLVTTVKYGSADSSRFLETTQDRYGRVIKTRRPGFAGESPAQVDSIQESHYDDQTNRLTSTTRTGFAKTFYGYGVLGDLVRQGIDLDDSNSLQEASNDRISDYNVEIINEGGAYWLLNESSTYPLLGSSSEQVISTSKQRLSGFGSDEIEEVRTFNVDGRLETRVVTINRSQALITAVTKRTSSGSLAESRRITKANRLTELLTFDGIKYNYNYDALGRLQSEIDPRIGVTNHTYYLGSFTPKSSNRLISSVQTDLYLNETFDSAGRPAVIKNASGKYSRRAYSQRGELLKVWGNAENPVRYNFNQLGEMVSLMSWRDVSPVIWNAAIWPVTEPAASTIQFVFDPASGLMQKRIDAPGAEVEFSYNEGGLISKRSWARSLPNGSARVATNYSYVSGTGELKGKTYNDGITPAVSYEYTRAGLLSKVTDGRGDEIYSYHSEQHFRLSSITKPVYYGNLIYTANYDVVGRPLGFMIGTSGDADQYFAHSHTWSDSDRLTRVDSKLGVGTLAHSYSYEPNSSLISGYTSHSLGFSTSFTYSPDRDLIATIASRFGVNADIATFSYSYFPQGQQSGFVRTGAAFSDMGLVGQSNTYTDRGEISTVSSYAGIPSSLLPGRQNYYVYDNGGNRTTARRTTDTGSDENYTTNSQGQYTSHDNKVFHTAGTVASEGIAVSVTGGGVSSPNAERQGAYWYQKVPLAGTSPVSTTLTFTATNPGAGSGGADLVKTVSKSVLLPGEGQTFVYDLDGNLTADGVWKYKWDAENRLVEMLNIDAIAGADARTLSFRYDYLDRRIQKRVLDRNNNELLARGFLYDGWNLIAEFAITAGGSCGSILRSYTWGLDTASSFSKNNSGGALLQISDHTTTESFFPSYDGNGNLVALTQASSNALVASYEYSPFGELLRCEGSYAKINPFRFSTKFVDDETGLIYFGYRYYDPRNGRFISRDPIGELGGNNLYRYAGNDPVNGSDKLGLYSDFDTGWDGPFGDFPGYIDIGLDTDFGWGFGIFVDPRLPVVGRPPLRSPRGLDFGTTRLSRSGLVFFNSDEAVTPNNSADYKIVLPRSRTPVQDIFWENGVVPPGIAGMADSLGVSFETAQTIAILGQMAAGMTPGVGQLLALAVVFDGKAPIYLRVIAGVGVVASVAPRVMGAASTALESSLSSLDDIGRAFGGPEGNAALPSNARLVLLRNGINGEAWEGQLLSSVLPETQTGLRTQITIRSNGPSNLKVRMDIVGKDGTGAIRLTDGKSSPTAPLQPNQVIVYPELEIHGGVVVGKGKAPYTGGTAIPPTKVDILIPPKN